MVTMVEIKGFEDFKKYTQDIDRDGPPVVFYFSGSKLPDGNSWCPDCVEAFKIAMGKKNKIIKTLNNYEEFTNFVDNLPEKGPASYFFFHGINQDTGRSWCISCQLAEPVVKSYLNELKKSVIFGYVDVGNQEYWKDRACPFRTDSRTRLMVIPTIIKWNGVQRLEGSQCNKRDLLQMLFEDDE